MSALSGIAAALLLGISIYGAIPTLHDHTDRSTSPTVISLAGASGTQEWMGFFFKSPMSQGRPEHDLFRQREVLEETLKGWTR